MLFLLQLLKNNMENSNSYKPTYTVNASVHLKNNAMTQAIISKI